MNSDSITVHVYDAGRKFLYMYYDDPISGKREKKSTGQITRKDANKVAGKWETELNAGTYHRPVKLSWADFQTRYEDEVFPHLSPSTRSMRSAVFSLLTEYFAPITAGHVATTRMMSEFQTQLRTRGKKPRTKKGKQKSADLKPAAREPYSEQSIRAYLGHLQPIWKWAKRQKFIRQIPEFEMPNIPTDDLMRGRAITGEEFDRMILAVDKVREADAEQWKRFLRGLYFSGLRLSEGLQLSWDDSEPFCVSTAGSVPQFRIYAEGQKRRKSQYVAMAPDFWDLIAQTPADDRRGRVLRLDNGSGQQTSTKQASRVISAIGRAAGIVTCANPKTFASAHDLRRSFGTRWAKRVSPLVLQTMMRHSKIETTQRYYADTAGDFANAEIWGDRMAAGSHFSSHSANQPR